MLHIGIISSEPSLCFYELDESFVIVTLTEANGQEWSRVAGHSLKREGDLDKIPDHPSLHSLHVSLESWIIDSRVYGIAGQGDVSSPRAQSALIYRDNKSPLVYWSIIQVGTGIFIESMIYLVTIYVMEIWLLTNIPTPSQRNRINRRKVGGYISPLCTLTAVQCSKSGGDYGQEGSQ